MNINLDKNFDLTIIMPFFKRIKTFKPIFRAKANYFQRNGIEVIIVADEPSEKDEIVEFVKEYPLINWKIIINENDHPWRNPAKAINVGIRNSSKKYILITDPELEFVTDIILLMREKLDYYPNHYTIGRVIFSNIEDDINALNFDKLDLLRLPYGSIMAQKSDFESIWGYTENYQIWGGEDDNIRTRLDLAGLKRLYCPEAMLIHREDFSLRGTTREQQRTMIPKDLLIDMFIPQEKISNSPKWGTDFNNVIYNWQEPSAIKHGLCTEYLKNIGEYYICSQPQFMQSFKLIALIPVYNESNRIGDCIKSLEPHCDGIIILDDGSSDDTYEKACSNKILAKVKKDRLQFNDLQNRNILLDIASFYSAEWFLFIDADERISSTVCDLDKIKINPTIDIVGFWIINLWNNENFYRTDMNDPCHSIDNGFWFRWRMFRNQGRMQIKNNNTLHFTPIPYRGNYHISQTLILHTGYLYPKQRLDKYQFYIDLDNVSTPNYYGGLLNNIGLELKHLNFIDQTVLNKAKKQLIIFIQKYYKHIQDIS